METIKIKEERLEFVGLDGGGIPIYNHNGKPFTGFIIEYFPNKPGIIESEIEYQNGYQDGLDRQYYENGKIEHEYNTKNNRLDGICRDWDKDGNLISEQIWSKGKLIKRIK